MLSQKAGAALLVLLAAALGTAPGSRGAGPPEPGEKDNLLAVAAALQRVDADAGTVTLKHVSGTTAADVLNLLALASETKPREGGEAIVAFEARAARAEKLPTLTNVPVRPGAGITREGKTAALQDLRAGEVVIVQLAPDRATGLAIAAIRTAGADEGGGKGKGAGKKGPSRTGFLDKVHAEPGGAEFRYVVFVPHGYDGAKALPVILFLHGSGQTGTDGRKQLTVGLGPAIKAREKDFPFLAVFPQARKGGWGAGAPDGRLALAILAEVEKAYAVDGERVYLTGVSMGGAGTWSLAAAHPRRFAAIVPVCASGDPRQAARLKDAPCWCFHGDADEVVKVKQSRDMIWAIRQAGGEPRYHEYPGVGHACWDRVYATPDLYEWLLGQRRGPDGTGRAQAPARKGPEDGPAAAYAAILLDWDAAQKGYRDALGRAKSDAERRRVASEKSPRPGPLADRCLKLAEAHPNAPPGRAALWWAVRNAPGTAAAKKAADRLIQGGFTRKEVDQLVTLFEAGEATEEVVRIAPRAVKKHLDHPRVAWLLAEVCCSYARSAKAPAAFAEAADLIAVRFADSPDITHFCEGLGCVAHPPWAAAYEKHLRAVVAKNRTRLVRCTASFALADVVHRAGRQDEAERLYARFIKEFEGLPAYPASDIDESLLASARAQLEDLRTWPRMLGKPVPQIEGEDLDGRAMKLSEYRGKVVLLSFWSTACAPCMKLVAHERALVARLKDKPFAIVGVNGQRPEAVRKALADSPLPWRSFKDQRAGGKPITQEWKLLGLPTLYLIDHGGVIRKRWIGAPPTRDLDHEIDALVQSAMRKE